MLGGTGSVSEGLQVGSGPPFVYSVQARDVPDLAVERTADRLTVLVPSVWASSWYEDDAVGFFRSAVLGANPAPSILVEKDFACLDERPEELDAFPNPNVDAC